MLFYAVIRLIRAVDPSKALTPCSSAVIRWSKRLIRSDPLPKPLILPLLLPLLSLFLSPLPLQTKI